MALREAGQAPLNVFLTGTYVGQLHETASGALLKYAPSAPQISYSLPVHGLDASVFAFRSHAFFDNLLPEGESRRFLARMYGLDTLQWSKITPTTFDVLANDLGLEHGARLAVDMAARVARQALPLLEEHQKRYGVHPVYAAMRAALQRQFAHIEACMAAG
ncbi:MAG: HipA N-terminal domain-containing protein [Desulfovibrio sp.]|nr:HipA N-terminal domain-containing protein [Desulfovibrio sp.]